MKFIGHAYLWELCNILSTNFVKTSARFILLLAEKESIVSSIRII